MVLAKRGTKTKLLELRSKLDNIVESGDLKSSDVLKISREMDQLVMEYYNAIEKKVQKTKKIAE